MEMPQISLLLPDPPAPRDLPKPRNTGPGFAHRLQLAREEAQAQRERPSSHPAPDQRQAERGGAERNPAGPGRAGAGERQPGSHDQDWQAVQIGQPFPDGGGGGGSQQGEQHNGASGSGELTAQAQADRGECDVLLDLLPTDGDSGIFELIMPGGERLGVVADVSSSRASFLLSTSSERLRQMLGRRRMELEGALAQRMGRDVSLAVI